MLCLHTDKFMSIVCTRTLIGKKVYKEPVIDFMIINDESNNHSEILFLLENGSSDTFILRLVSFPGKCFLFSYFLFLLFYGQKQHSER